MKQIQHDEIDLLKLFGTLWDRRWFITAFTLIAMLIGSGFLFFKEATYSSKLNLFFDNTPPFYKTSKVIADLDKNFYLKSNFLNWKKNNKKTLLTYDKFSNTENVNGFSVTRPASSQLAIIKKNMQNDYFIQINSGDVSILRDLFKYTHYINDIMLKDYINRAKDERKHMEIRFKALSLSDGSIIEEFLSIDRFIVNASKGAQVFTIKNPSKPQKTSPRPKLILIISVLLGGMVGVMYVLISNAIRKLKESSAKS